MGYATIFIMYALFDQRVIEYYNQSYGDYEKIWRVGKNFTIHYGFYDANNKTHDKAQLNMVRVLAQKARIQATDQVLDAGCGVGGPAVWLAKSTGARVVGININAKQLEIARKLAKDSRVENLVTFLCRDFMDTKLPAHSFDVVLGLESICYAEDKKGFLKEAKRLLRPNGRIVISDGFLKKEQLAREEEQKMSIWLAGWAVPHFASVSQCQRYLQELGFRNIEYQDITANVMPSSVFLYRASILLYPVGKLLELIGLRTRVQAQNMRSAYYQHTTLKKGIWTHGIFCGIC